MRRLPSASITEMQPTATPRGVLHVALAILLASALMSILAPRALARAETFTEVLTIPLQGVVVEGCEEPIELQGSLHDVLHFTSNAHGGLSLHSVTSAAGIRGTGLISGAQYRGVGATVQTSYLSSAPDGSPIDHLTSTLVDRTRIVGTGGAMTLDIRTTFHITKVDAENVVIFERAEVSCR